LFTTKEELDKTLDFIVSNYEIINPNVFILESKVRPEELFVTFNVEKGSQPVSSQWKTILVHRKKQTNTIYTINALNEVVKSMTGGQMDNSFVIDWEEFRNCILSTSNSSYKKIPTKIYKTLNLEN
jgi:hypothetical protein